jgi:two-component system chemotaxis response regulator CheY
MKTVLVADDSSFMRKKIIQIIEQDDFRVISEAKDGEETIIKYKYYEPDIVLLDLTMPKIDGIMALKEIMTINANAKVIVFSALATSYSIKEVIRSGAKDFIVKPYFEQLIPTLRKL